MSRLFAAIGRFSVRFRWLIVAVWVIGTLASVHFLPTLSSAVQNDNTNFLPSSAPSMVASQLVSPLENSRQIAVPVIVATRDGSELTASQESAIAALEHQLGGVSGALAVKDAGASPNGQADLINVYTANTRGSANQTAITSFVNAVTTQISKAGLPSDLQAHVSGSAADNVATNSSGTDKKIQGLSILFIIVLLFLVFRSLLAPVLTLLPAVVVVAASGPIVGEAAKHGLQVSQLAQLMLIVLVLGAGTDYGLFLIFRVREEMRNGLQSREAIVRAVERVGESITFSAATVIAALISLLAASFAIYSNLGLPLAIGVFLMLVAGLTLMPALLAIFGRAVFWPAKIVPIPASQRRPGTWGRLASAVVQKPATTLVIGVLLFGAMAAAAFGYQSAGFGGDTTPPTGSDAALGDALVAKYYPNVSSTPTLIVFQLPQSAWQDPQALVTAENELRAKPEFTHVTGPLSPNDHVISPQQLTQLHAQFGAPGALPAAADPATLGTVTPSEYQAYRSTALYVSADGRIVVYNVTLAAGDAASRAAMSAVPAIRADAAQVGQSISATGNGVAGLAAGFYDVSNTSSNDLKTVIPIAILIIGLLLALVMRSLVAPLYLIVSVAMSYVASLGLSVLLFTKIGHSDGLSFILPFLLFLFLMALGEDYNILIMTRIREEAHDLPLRRAVVKAVGATGTTITSAGLIMAGTFGVFAIVGSGQGDTQLRDVGAGIALGILMDTFLVRSLLVPSTVVLLGRWNWWPSRLAGRSGDVDTAAEAEAMLPR